MFALFKICIISPSKTRFMLKTNDENNEKLAFRKTEEVSQSLSSKLKQIRNHYKTNNCLLESLTTSQL